MVWMSSNRSSTCDHVTYTNVVVSFKLYTCTICCCQLPYTACRTLEKPFCRMKAAMAPSDASPWRLM